MPITTLSAREFNQHTSSAKKKASKGPVFITNHGKTEHVLLTLEQYRQLTKKSESLLDIIGQKEDEADFEFNPPRFSGHFHPADLS